MEKKAPDGNTIGSFFIDIVCIPLAVSINATAASTFRRSTIVDCTTVASKFGDRECHATEKRTRVFALAARSAFLVGNTVVCALNEKLRGALEPYD